MCKDNANMSIYNAVRSCPKEAQKAIGAGRLRGKTDINPMWRLKVLTEQFGPCGIGFTISIKRTWIEEGANGERTANVEVALRYKYNGEWSEDVAGIGGAMLIEKETNGLHTDDDAFKKAYTDAISVACKAIGVAADIYYANDPESKYYSGDNGPMQTPDVPTAPKTLSKYQTVKELIQGKSMSIEACEEWIRKKYGSAIQINKLTDEQFNELCSAIRNAK
ncbi:MAG: hypothetical protein IJY01_00560 [Clostridia bacterium]|nr:hypothetical protein [Clostridia bacterium]